MGKHSSPKQLVYGNHEMHDEQGDKNTVGIRTYKAKETI
jgi:hypothetical protein